MLRAVRMTREQIHREFGRHSNIPECCIEWFLVLVRPEHTAWALGYHVIIHEWHPGGCGYNPCPKCLTQGTFAQVHLCDATCPPYSQWLGELRAST
jgi:hypothetical protein